MEVGTHLFVFQWRLAISTSVASSLTAISVIVQGLYIQGILTTGSFREANRKSDTTEKGKRVRELGSLKKDNMRLIIGTHNCISTLSHRVEYVSVE